MDGKVLLEEWKSRLGLQDWRIVLKDECEPEDMALESCDGCTVWTESIKSATVQILDPKFYGTRIVPFDYEKTLVHELLHLKFCLLDESGNDLQDRHVHQLIDDLARALVDAKRAGDAEEQS